MTESQPLDPLGDLIRAGLEIERAKNDAIQRLGAEVARLTRELNDARSTPPFARDRARVTATVPCTCCRACGVILPCFETTEGEPCARRCFCRAASGEDRT